MNHLKNRNEFLNETEIPIKKTRKIKKPIIEIVNLYCEKYPEFTEFFKKFIERFSRKQYFNERLYSDYCDGPRDWHPEAEVNMLENEILAKYPGDDIWVDFHNDLLDSHWSRKVEWGVE